MSRLALLLCLSAAFGIVLPGSAAQADKKASLWEKVKKHF